jgi:uncharacterized protein YndB with AHSA1/START domain
MNDAALKTVKPFTTSRTFHVARERLFNAWGSGESVKRWFAPPPCTIAEAKVEMRVGGPFELLMRVPGGEHRLRGVFREVSPPERLVIDMMVEDGKGHELFRAYTELGFVSMVGETRLDVTQTYTLLDPAAAHMVGGAPQGWAGTLDNLAGELRRVEAAGSVVHGDFTVERTYEAPVERVWLALSDEAAKAKWFGGPESQWRPIERSIDFRVGGRERAQGRWESGVVTTFDAIYHDIVPNERIVYSYVMHIDEKKISVSLATMKLNPAGDRRTRLTVTEQGAFLDGYDDAGAREKGTGFLLDKLGASLNT